jgi:hypothetical protein
VAVVLTVATGLDYLVSIVRVMRRADPA